MRLAWTSKTLVGRLEGQRRLTPAAAEQVGAQLAPASRRNLYGRLDQADAKILDQITAGGEVAVSPPGSGLVAGQRKFFVARCFSPPGDCEIQAA